MESVSATRALPHGEGVHAFVGTNDDVPSHTHFIEIEVVNTVPGVQLASSGGTGYLLDAGTRRLCVTRGDLETIERESLETEVEGLRVAEAAFEAAIDRELAELGVESFPEWRVAHGMRNDFTARDARDCRTRKTPEAGDDEVAAVRKRVYQTTGDSVARQFQLLYSRDIRPLRSIKVLRDDVLHPDIEREMEFNDRQAQLVADKISGANPRKR